LDDVTVETVFLNYSHRAMGYRVTWQGHSVVYAMDRLCYEDHIDKALLHLARQADLLILKAPNSFCEGGIPSSPRLWKDNLWQTGIETAKAAGVKRIVFSSTAATYGNPERVPIEESDRTEPTNAYGETKLAMERMMRWFDTAHGIKFVSLRYFNAAGAHENGLIGEDHKPETHLIPLVLQVALGQREAIAMFGDDYPTPDGTCIRDYIHVQDLADAHVLGEAASLSQGEQLVARRIGLRAVQALQGPVDEQHRQPMHGRPRRELGTRTSLCREHADGDQVVERALVARLLAPEQFLDHVLGIAFAHDSTLLHVSRLPPHRDVVAQRRAGRGTALRRRCGAGC